MTYICLFAPVLRYKLDISDELSAVIKIMKGNEDKIRVVLNKADAISVQQLMRVYGALMWSLGKVFETPEVCRVYIGSFWANPPANPDTRDLLQAEMDDLLEDLRELPKQSAVRKVNELVKRMRLLRAHTYILHELRCNMPSMMGQKKAQEKMCDPGRMAEIFRAVHKKHNLPPGDFPEIRKFISTAKELNFTEFPRVDGSRLRSGKLLEELDLAMSQDIPRLLESMPGMAGQGTNRLAGEAGAPTFVNDDADLYK
jgi:hypothetical protein